jgi:hypothetical protein
MSDMADLGTELASTSGYMTAKVFVGCMFLGGAASTWALRSWKICENEKQEMIAAETSLGTKLRLTPRRLFMNKRV